MTDQTSLESRRAQLATERDRLASHLAALEAGSDTGPAFDENFADSGQVAAEQGEYKALAANLRAELEEVEHALGKFDEGTYGRCEVCGDPIADARLEAMPAARYCINHA